ncbi:MAG: hypothetical protein ACREYF_21960, partial [Gammaproteobacteria bacterium]
MTTNTVAGPLPPTSGYTYAVELSVDEAITAGATRVDFSQPLPVFVDNFLDFPVGGIVPVGWYDREKSAWIPSDNGRIVKILGRDGDGLALLDVDGSGNAASATQLVELGISAPERAQLAALYPAGKSLWRVAVTHFTPWDCNWPYGPPEDAEPPPPEEPESEDEDQPDPEDSDECEGCSIEAQSQTLGEEIAITGTPFKLHYRSDRVPGDKSAYTLAIPLTGASVPSSLKRIDLKIAIAGRAFAQSFTPTPSLSYTYLWDGLDAYARPVTGFATARVDITYVYPAVYYAPGDFGQAFAVVSATPGVAIGANETAREITLATHYEISLGAFTPTAAGLGGWSLGVHHAYDPVSTTLYTGDGGKRSASSLGAVIDRVAGTAVLGYSGDGGPAREAKLSYPVDVALGSDGSLYITDYVNNRIRRVGPDGIITTVAGTGVYGYSGDGGPATEAKLYYPWGVALGSDGSLYIADTHNHRVRKVSSPLPGFINSEIVIASEDGVALYRFSASGRHLQTIDSSTGAARDSFTYDETGRIIEVRDVDGDLTRIERDANGGPTAIVSPDGQRTTLMLDANGYLASVTNPAGERHTMEYTDEGLLTAFIDANGNSNRFEYDDLGRLIKDTDAGGSGWTLARTEHADGYTSSMTTAEGRTTTFTVEPLSTGDRRQVNTYSDGTVQTKLFKTNGEETTTAPDGTVTTKLEGPDPRFGILAPVPISVTTRLPSGLTATATTARTATLTDPDDPLSLILLTDTVTVNGKAYKRSYKATTKTWTNTSPEGRQSTTLIDLQGRPLTRHTVGLEPIHYRYENRGRLTEATAGQADETRTTSIRYYQDGPSKGYVQTLIDALGRTVEYDYDLAGRVVQQALPDGREIAYGYDANGNVTEIV